MKSLIFLLLFICFNAEATMSGASNQTFDTSLNSIGELPSVHTSKAIGGSRVGMSIYIDYSENTLPVYVLNGDNVKASEDSSFYNHLSLFYGLTDKLDIGASLTNIIKQDVSDVQNQGFFAAEGLTHYKLNTKYQILNRSKKYLGLSAVFGYGQVLADNTPYNGVSPGPSLSLEMVIDKKTGSFLNALNIGYVKHAPGEAVASVSEFTPIKQATVFSLGTQYFLNPSWTLEGELHGSLTDADTSVIDRSKDSFEVLTGASYKTRYYKNQIQLKVGVTKGLNKGLATPEIRFFSGLSIEFGMSNKVNSISNKSEEISQTVILNENDDVEKKLQNFASGEENKPEYQKIILNYVEFDFNSFDLTIDSKKSLGKVFSYLKRSDYGSLLIIGHTDFYGTTYYNEKLSMQRALEVMKHFRVLGLDENSMKFTGYGERRPLTLNTSEESRKRNRRVEIILKNKIIVDNKLEDSTKGSNEN